ncbi:DivIVA domain-containing protein [Actinoplanes subtropicus]|uniref:DivIVA domain-containing protein n=1 Tax=Actinoplanes subtropicus TaxID=543632 RepID=UPI000551FDA4|nr:DivIVA domain-containing protein [Actinoplanes subtropicus]
MRLTPADIHNMTFKKAALGRRGYDGEQVDALLDAVTLEMIELLEENEVLRGQARRAGSAVADRTPPDPAVMQLSAANDVLYRARLASDRAEENARKLRNQLDRVRRAATAAVVGKPGADADGVLDMARRTADRQVRDACLEADALLLDARERSERIAEGARSTAQGIVESSRRRDDDAEADLERRCAALAREVDELAGFAGSYRTALMDHVRRQGQF